MYVVLYTLVNFTTTGNCYEPTLADSRLTLSFIHRKGGFWQNQTQLVFLAGVQRGRDSSRGWGFVPFDKNETPPRTSRARHGLVLRVSGAFIVNVDAVPSTDWEFRERRFEKTKRDSRSG
jgi:hypothetical protein